MVGMYLTDAWHPKSCRLSHFSSSCSTDFSFIVNPLKNACIHNIFNIDIFHECQKCNECIIEKFDWICPCICHCVCHLVVGQSTHSKNQFRKTSPIMVFSQWVTTGLLWSVWLMQDAANIAVYLPRQLTGIQFFLLFNSHCIGAVGYMLYKGGAKIQQVVDEKSKVAMLFDLTSLVDPIYAIILFYFKLHSQIPAGTTWVFIGLLAGREIAMSIKHTSDQSFLSAIRMSAKDTAMASYDLNNLIPHFSGLP